MKSRIGVVPWSPLARGRLTRPWAAESARTRTDQYGNKLYESTVDADRKVVEQVAAIAAARGVPMAQIASAWITQKPFITAPIIGATQPQHLDDAVGGPERQAGGGRNRAIGGSLRAPRHFRTLVIP